MSESEFGSFGDIFEGDGNESFFCWVQVAGPCEGEEIVGIDLDVAAGDYDIGGNVRFGVGAIAGPAFQLDKVGAVFARIDFEVCDGSVGAEPLAHVLGTCPCIEDPLPAGPNDTA